MEIKIPSHRIKFVMVLRQCWFYSLDVLETAAAGQKLKIRMHLKYVLVMCVQNMPICHNNFFEYEQCQCTDVASVVLIFIAILLQLRFFLLQTNEVFERTITHTAIRTMWSHNENIRNGHVSTDFVIYLSVVVLCFAVVYCFLLFGYR